MNGTVLFVGYLIALVVVFTGWCWVWIRWWDEWLTPRAMRWYCRRHDLPEDMWEEFR